MEGVAMRVGRFQVMATLQAARAFILGMSESMARSWGLNRAIFYAAAKRGFRKKPGMIRTKGRVFRKPIEETKTVYHLGDEMAFKGVQRGKTYFTIGGQVQTDRDFERQIEARFGGMFKKAWKEALALVKKYDREVLLSQRSFYQLVYKPRRDVLAEKWTGLSAKAS